MDVEVINGMECKVCEKWKIISSYLQIAMRYVHVKQLERDAETAIVTDEKRWTRVQSLLLIVNWVPEAFVRL